MTNYTKPAIILPTSSGFTGKPLRDPILSGLSDGDMRYLFDLDFSWCYPGGDFSTRSAPADPTDNQVIYDIAQRADGSYTHNTVFESPRTTYAGGGFDFSANTHAPFGVKAPSDTWSSIFDGSQNFMVCGYYMLPSEMDFKPSDGLVQMFGTGTANGLYVTNEEAVVFGQINPSGGNKSIRFYRQKAVGTQVDIMTLDVSGSYFFGEMCQISYWRNSNETGCRVKSASGEVSAVGTVGDDNVDNPSGKGPVWGMSGGPNQTLGTENMAANNYRVYRGFIEDLGASGRDPLTVLDADWDRVIARKTASGGTIFA